MAVEEKRARSMPVVAIGSYAIYLAFVLSSVLSSVVKVISYRFGFHPW
ncbi:hypothetical protein AB0M92_11340 [Streptomyces sp. NPDC051582]